MQQMDETFLNYSQRKGEKYFYDLLKPLASLETLQAEDFIDWGQEEKFSTAIGVGECAGVMIDLVATLILEAEEKIAASEECLLITNGPMEFIMLMPPGTYCKSLIAATGCAV